jgi:hypothetical protein
MPNLPPPNYEFIADCQSAELDLARFLEKLKETYGPHVIREILPVQTRIFLRRTTHDYLAHLPQNSYSALARQAARKVRQAKKDGEAALKKFRNL